MWTCPKCSRTFKHATNYHSCVKVDADKLFLNKNVVVKKIYDRIINEVKKFGAFQISPVKSRIILKNVTSFASGKPMKDALDIHFMLNREVNEFPVYKSFRYSKSKVSNFIRLDKTEQVVKQPVKRLKESYHSRDV